VPRCGPHSGPPLPCPESRTSWAEDIVGYWQSEPRPVEGREAYVGKIAELLTAFPDLRLDLVDTATVAGATDDEQLVYLHYVGRGTGQDGPVAIRGLDRVRTRNGIVVENVIRYDQVDIA
jgi:SnoaL-like domain